MKGCLKKDKGKVECGDATPVLHKDSFPALKQVRLTDYKVRIISGKEGTAAKTRVLIESTDGNEEWGTVGVSENIIEASWQALVDSVEYKLFKDESRK